jgi:hypothetical protein
MTKMVIIDCGMIHVRDLLKKWPTRRDLLEDARRAEASLKLVAVHRWFARESVPPKYWVSLTEGAKERGIDVTNDDFARAHCLASISTT